MPAASVSTDPSQLSAALISATRSLSAVSYVRSLRRSPSFSSTWSLLPLPSFVSLSILSGSGQAGGRKKWG